MGAEQEREPVASEAPRPAGWQERTARAHGVVLIDFVRSEVQFSGKVSPFDLAETVMTVPLETVLATAAHHLSESAKLLQLARARGGLLNGG